jgi:hypothetical protein
MGGDLDLVRRLRNHGWLWFHRPYGGDSHRQGGWVIRAFVQEVRYRSLLAINSTLAELFPRAGAGAWNGLVDVVETAVNLPNGGPLASPDDPGYISLAQARVPYAPGDEIGPGAEFGVAALATRGVGKAAANAEAQTATSAAANAISGLNLKKSLASEQLLAELVSGRGVSVAGSGANVNLRDAGRLVAEYGGQPADWSKVSSRSYSATDGTRFEIHTYRNAATGQVVEPKTIPLK